MCCFTPIKVAQYTSHKFRNELLKHGHRQSMSRKGECWVNAPMERFFGNWSPVAMEKLAA